MSPANTTLPVVNSYDEWSPLEEVIVGDPVHLAYDDDVSFRLFFHDNVGGSSVRTGTWAPSADAPDERRLRAEMAEDLAGFVDLLTTHGVTVRRPDERREAAEIRTADWTSVAGHSVMPRDLLLVVGDEIIETAPMVRSRYFETNLYKTLLVEYFTGGAKWTVAPRSRLREEDFDFGYVRQSGYAGAIPEKPVPEVMFDAAQVLRLGRDLLFNCSTENHRLGMRWLARQLGEDFRLHEVRVTDNHIDARVLALRPGTLLLHEKVQPSQLPEFLRGWDTVRYTPPDTPLAGLYGDRPVLASAGIGMNVLSLDTERVVVQDDQPELIAALRAKGFEPVPCRWRHGRVIGGGFHCMTLDVRRRGSLESYVD